MRYILFIKEECPYCQEAKNLLEDRGMSYNTVTVNDDQEQVLREIKDAYEWTTVPIVFFRDGDDIKFIGGFDDLTDYIEKNGQ